MSRVQVPCIIAIDQGTQSTRCIIYDQNFNTLGVGRAKNTQIREHPGWLEHDPEEIRKNVNITISEAITRTHDKLGDKEPVFKAVGITNQRETVCIWNKKTGKPYANAIVWSDTRTNEITSRYAEKHGGVDAFQETTGLQINTYFSAVKIRWLMENVPEVKEALEKGEAAIGTMDSWVIYSLTSGKVHVTDITNAARTLLFDINTLTWSEKMCKFFDIPMEALPRICSCAEEYGRISSIQLPVQVQNIPICGCAGDQQAACVGQMLLKKGEIKCTYGTGAFILVHTGNDKPFLSKHKLLTTPLYQMGPNVPVTWGLEGAIATAGAGVTWLQDSLCLFKDSNEMERLANSVDDTNGVYVVPAFSGLFAPRWRKDARGTIVGLTGAATRAHICRSMLESIAFQCNEVLGALTQDMGIKVSDMLFKTDGGMTNNQLLMQMTADLCGVEVSASVENEVTAIGSAMCAAIGCGLYSSIEEVSKKNCHLARRNFTPKMTPAKREIKLSCWNDAVDRSLDSLKFPASCSKE